MSKAETERQRDAMKLKAKKLVRTLGIAIEVVPAKELPSAKATNPGAHYRVVFKRAQNQTQAFSFDYWGTAYEKENHVGPATHDVVMTALAAPQGQKFFSPIEREMFRQMFEPPPEPPPEARETEVIPVGDGITPIPRVSGA